MTRKETANLIRTIREYIRDARSLKQINNFDQYYHGKIQGYLTVIRRLQFTKELKPQVRKIPIRFEITSAHLACFWGLDHNWVH